MFVFYIDFAFRSSRCFCCGYSLTILSPLLLGDPEVEAED